MATAISIREATEADLDAMVEVSLAAFPMDPVWTYVFSKHHEYPEETWKLTRLEYTAYLKNKKGKWRFMVAEMPKKDDESTRVVAAISLWEFVDGDEWTFVERVENTGGDIGASEVQQDIEFRKAFENRLDADPMRVQVFDAATTKAENMYHNLPYGEQQIRLKILATHPDYQRQGAASKMLFWGMCLAREQLKFLTLLAGPMGKKLYTKSCFYEQGAVDVQVEGEQDKATFFAMVCNAI